MKTIEEMSNALRGKSLRRRSARGVRVLGKIIDFRCNPTLGIHELRLKGAFDNSDLEEFDFTLTMEQAEELVNRGRFCLRLSVGDVIRYEIC